ncbi:hypothetical protein H072_1843 [Dactylellina haptotyla CBS 200.50]|uniref:Uncharacterized protein n=1 Tax=Dactylellina haptotyla (strain CBS 200.50) TaxID=1284197 RepID=S8AMV0_DACHA|nr:hypothetical protein H072_1843 [Dactylellina haptotyla CBS 200.50]
MSGSLFITSGSLFIVSKTKFIEPEASLRYCKFLSNRKNGMKRYIVNAQVLSTLRSWAATDCSSTIVIKGASLRLPAQCQDFGADLIECAKGSNIPLIWALEAAPRDDRDRISSAVDILKYLVFQILKINSNTLPRELNATTFRSPGTENEWFLWLTALLSTLPRVIIVVDSALLGERLEGDIAWIDAFSRVFNDLKGRDSPTIVKVVLLNSEISDIKSDYTTLRLQASKGKVDGRGNIAINRKKAQRGFRATLRGAR